MMKEVIFEIVKYVVGGLTALNVWIVVEIFKLKRKQDLNKQKDMSDHELLVEIKDDVKELASRVHSLEIAFAGSGIKIKND